MEPLKDWYRYLDEVSRPVRRDTDPDTVAEDREWRPWKQTMNVPDNGDGQSFNRRPERNCSDAGLPESILPPPLFSGLGGGPMGAGPCMPASTHFEDLTVNDTLQPIPEFSVLSLRPPVLEIDTPRLRRRGDVKINPTGLNGITADRDPDAAFTVDPAQATVSPQRETFTPIEAPPKVDSTPDESGYGAGVAPPSSENVEPFTPEETPELVSLEDNGALSDRAPRHWELLTQIRARDVAQNSYKAPFQETREELVQRLLDPELTLEDTARLLDVCPTTVRRYTNKGLLRCFRTPGNQRRFRLSDVTEFLVLRKTDPGGETAEDEGSDD